MQRILSKGSPNDIEKTTNNYAMPQSELRRLSLLSSVLDNSSFVASRSTRNIYLDDDDSDSIGGQYNTPPPTTTTTATNTSAAKPKRRKSITLDDSFTVKQGTYVYTN